jgi:hypothetical protein
MLQAILGNELGHFDDRLSSVSSLYRSHIRWLSHRSLRNINVMDNASASFALEASVAQTQYAPSPAVKLVGKLNSPEPDIPNVG